MRHRPLGSTGLPVPEIGYGTRGIRGSMWVSAREEELIRALRNAALSGGRTLTSDQPGILAKHRWERNFCQA